MEKIKHAVTLIRAGQQAKLLQTITSNSQTCRSISTTITLQRKRQQRRYRPPIFPFHYYGAAHRFVRGQCVDGERYGPLVDKPDYTFLDGRPTPLTPEQVKERNNRIDMAAAAVQYMKEMETVKEYNKSESPKLTKYWIPERIKGRS